MTPFLHIIYCKTVRVLFKVGKYIKSYSIVFQLTRLFMEQLIALGVPDVRNVTLIESESAMNVTFQVYSNRGRSQGNAKFIAQTRTTLSVLHATSFFAV